MRDHGCPARRGWRPWSRLHRDLKQRMLPCRGSANVWRPGQLGWVLKANCNEPLNAVTKRREPGELRGWMRVCLLNSVVHLRREELLAYRDHPGSRTAPDGLDSELFRWVPCSGPTCIPALVVGGCSPWLWEAAVLLLTTHIAKWWALESCLCCSSSLCDSLPQADYSMPAFFSLLGA